jgi:transposase-like protein
MPGDLQGPCQSKKMAGIRRFLSFGPVGRDFVAPSIGPFRQLLVSEFGRYVFGVPATSWFLCLFIVPPWTGRTVPLGGSPQKNRRGRQTVDRPTEDHVRAGGAQLPARSFHVANVQASTLRPLLFQHVDRLSTLMTDESSSYRATDPHYWQHQKVNYGLSEYGRRDKTGHWNTNTVENFFSIFKRRIIGVYHHVSEAI